MVRIGDHLLISLSFWPTLLSENLGDGHIEGNEEDTNADIGDVSVLADVSMSEA